MITVIFELVASPTEVISLAWLFFLRRNRAPHFHTQFNVHLHKVDTEVLHV